MEKKEALQEIVCLGASKCCQNRRSTYKSY